MSQRLLPLLVLAVGGCYGSFRLSTKVWEFNGTVSDSIVVQEVLFLAMVVVPVYEVTLFVDAIVLNTIEAFTGSNPIGAVDADGTPVVVDGKARRLRRAANHLELTDGSGRVATAELRADGSLAVVGPDGDVAVVDAERIRALEDAWREGGKPALAEALTALLSERMVLAR